MQNNFKSYILSFVLIGFFSYIIYIISVIYSKYDHKKDYFESDQPLRCKEMSYKTKSGPYYAIASLQGSGNKWARDLIQQASGI